MAQRAIMRRSIALLLAALALAGCDRRAGDGPVVVSAIGGSPKIIAPAKLTDDLPSRLLMSATAQGLVRLDAAGQIEPGLAERWTVIDNGLSYIFRLQDARWSDGEPVTSEQIVTILRRALKDRTDNPLAPWLSAIDEIVAMTPEVIEIHLSRARPDLLRRLAQPELALFRMNPPGGGGPLRLANRRGNVVVLRPIPDDDGDPDEDAPKPDPRNDVELIGERASLAIVRFARHHSDLVTGGTVADWPLVAGIDIPASSIHRDPAEGLFGLAVVDRSGFLSDATARAAVAAAIDRTGMTAALAPDWAPAETLLPEELDSAAAPAAPGWTQGTLDQRRAAARIVTASWRATHPDPLTLRIALPDGPGGTLLYGWIGSALRSIGIEPQRVALDADADLRLIDRVSPFDTARWYLVTACAPCGDDAHAAIEAARTAATSRDRAAAIAKADAALTADIAFIPLATPLRWSLVAPGLDEWQANPRAWHPLNELRSPTK
jgi:peptide/nickel transport system substrate-binding protein